MKFTIHLLLSYICASFGFKDFPLMHSITKFLPLLKCEVWTQSGKNHKVPNDVMKYYFQSGKVCLARVSDTLEENQIFIGDILPDMNQTSETQGIVMFSNDDKNIFEMENNIKINQEILFLNMSSGEVYEAYSLEYGSIIHRRLGGLQKLKNYNNSIINSFTNQSFVERRSNLNGKNFIGMTDNFYPYSNLDLNFIHAAMFHEDNQTYDVSHFAKGMLHTLHIHYTAL